MALTDGQLANALKSGLAATAVPPIVVVANAYQARIFGTDGQDPAKLIELGTGDLDVLTASVLQTHIRKKEVLWESISGSIQQATPNLAAAVTLTSPQLRQWKAQCGKVTRASGRTGDASPKTMHEVAARAAWHCQFRGCGKDLRTHAPTGSKGNYSYFAHIVASSPNGPRGDARRSSILADDPDNLLLLCDECHRLIDRVNPDTYDESVLQEMRRENVHEVSRLLGTLQHQDAEMLVVMSNISGQPSFFEERKAEEALWKAGLRRAAKGPEWFAKQAPFGHNPHESAYWDTLFTELNNSTHRLQAILAGVGQQRKALAVFPLHSTSVQLLAGRLVGDVGGVYPFQFHRDQITGNTGGQWSWPEGAPTPVADKYIHRVERDHQGEKEACLLINLTFGIGADRLPPGCADASGFKLPTVIVTVANPASNVISHPKDLELFGKALDDALRLLQDQWQVERIHLFVGAPSSACFRVGQKMQVRHQARFLCHETASGKGAFLPTIEISADQVVISQTGKAIKFT